jgi:hypothetical protein
MKRFGALLNAPTKARGPTAIKSCIRFGRGLIASALLSGAAFAMVPVSAEAAAAPLEASCQLHSAGNKVKRVVYIIFDNVHLRRDNPNVPSDLEQIPSLLNFMQENGVVSGNHHTPLISHTADDILTGLTGVYGDRHGSPISNSFRIYKKDNSTSVSQTSFVYWTTTTAQSHPEAGENLPVLVNENGKNAPAPWAAYTRAGCDVGAFSLNGLAIENNTDVANIFGSTVAKTAANQDYEGVAVHCAKGSSLCNKAFARPDLLPDEPGGYTGFLGLFGNINVQPVLSPSGPVTDLEGTVITDPFSNKPGFPTDFDPSPTASLGYAAKMLEAGVPVVYTYVADAHDPHHPDIPNGNAINPNNGNAYGPGEAGYVAALKTYDQAFGKFFSRLKADGIDASNTLFVVVPDENDHFAGGPPSPANCDGVTTPCTYANVGEIDASLDKLLLSERQNSTSFLVHADSAPNVYVNGNPAATDALTRTMEHDLDALTATSAITGNPDKLSKLLADRAEMKLLHMITVSPQRNATVTMFGNDNYFFETGNACTPTTTLVCESPAFAWNHGDFQKDITRTWFGLAGPGVEKKGRNDSVFSDHTDIRPTVLTLVGLKDDYVHDGRVLAEDIDPRALPDSLQDSLFSYVELSKAYKQINAPKGSVGVNSLVAANRAITSVSNNDAIYNKYLTTIGAITTERNQLAGEMITLLDGAAFKNQNIRDFAKVVELIVRAGILTDKVEDLAGR